MIPHKNQMIGDRLWSSQSDDVFNPISFYNQDVIKEVGFSDTRLASRDIPFLPPIILTKDKGGANENQINDR